MKPNSRPPTLNIVRRLPPLLPATGTACQELPLVTDQGFLLLQSAFIGCYSESQPSDRNRLCIVDLDAASVRHDEGSHGMHLMQSDSRCGPVGSSRNCRETQKLVN